jgi:hypothetical protein
LYRMPPDTSQGSAVCGRERISHATHATTAQAIAWAGAGRLVLSGKNLLSSGRTIRELPYETVETLAKFFRSGWAQLLCRKADPMVILERLKKECEK